MGRIKATAEGKQEGESAVLRKESLLFREAGPPGSMMRGLSFFGEEESCCSFYEASRTGWPLITQGKQLINN